MSVIITGRRGGHTLDKNTQDVEYRMYSRNASTRTREVSEYLTIFGHVNSDCYGDRLNSWDRCTSSSVRLRLYPWCGQGSIMLTVCAVDLGLHAADDTDLMVPLATDVAYVE